MRFDSCCELFRFILAAALSPLCPNSISRIIYEALSGDCSMHESNEDRKIQTCSSSSVLHGLLCIRFLIHITYTIYNIRVQTHTQHTASLYIYICIICILYVRNRIYSKYIYIYDVLEMAAKRTLHCTTL